MQSSVFLFQTKFISEMIREETPETPAIKKENTMMLQVTFLVEYNKTLKPYRRLTSIKVSSD